MKTLKIAGIYLIMVAVSYLDITQSLLFDFKSFIPTLFFSVAALFFTFRLTIVSTFTEKLPKRDEIKNKMIAFNEYLSKYIFWTIGYGVLGIFLSKFCKDINITAHVELLKYMNAYLIRTFIALGRGLILFTLFFTLYEFIRICMISQDLAKLYIMKSFDTENKK